MPPAFPAEHAWGTESRRGHVGQRRDRSKPETQHRGCSRDSKLDCRRDGDHPREQRGLESVGSMFWELLRPGIQVK